MRSPAPTPVPAGIDASALDNIRAAGGDALARKIALMFVETAPDRILSLREAVRLEDANAIEQVAHSLKSSAAQVGAARLAETCGLLESRARRGDVADAAEQVEIAAKALRVYADWVRGS